MYSNSERYINFSFYETQKFIVLLIPTKLSTVKFYYKALFQSKILNTVLYFWVKSQKKKYGSFRKLCSFKVIYDFG